MASNIFQRIRTRRVIARARTLSRDGLPLRAIDLLRGFNRQYPSPAVEAELVRVRHEGFYTLTRTATSGPWPPKTNDLFTDTDGIPEIDVAQISAERIRSGVFNHGSIIVRGLLGPQDVEALRESIKNTYAAHDRHLAGAPLDETAPWFFPFEPSPREGVNADLSRDWFRSTGAELAADSPRGLFNLVECLDRNGIIDLITEYLGERPALSVRKTSLRVVPHDQNAEHGWHQDGAFLGNGIRTMNLWIALTDCGTDAPSMDMVPRRLGSIVPTGTEGAAFDWSVSAREIDKVCGEQGPTHLHFAAGDAIIFDEMNLHRTSTRPGMTKERLAIEAWFFAPSCYPEDQLPILV